MTPQDIDHLLHRLEGLDDFVLLDCARRRSDDQGSQLFLDPVVWLRCRPGDDARDFLRQAQSWAERGRYLAGWFAYEFGVALEPAPARWGRGKTAGDAPPLAVLGVFAEALPPERWPGSPLGQERAPVAQCGVDGVRPGMTRDDYLEAVRKIQAYIAAGDTYQVNFTLPLFFRVSGAASALYRRLRDRQRVAYGAWIREGGREIMSFSPELFFHWQEGRLRTRPMKGTSRRGADLAEDARQAELLRQSVKNRAENVMIVDLLRNDLAHLLHRTGGGEVRVDELFTVETYETLLQMTSTVSARPSRPGRPDLVELFSALFPCGSVTGAPKIRTMEIIHELEGAPRGVYTGAIGCIGPRRTVFSVPIRTLELAGGAGRMGIGSGIVHDSDPAGEWEECLLKAEFLTREQPDCRLIETLRWQPAGGYWLLREHLERLRDSAAWMLYPCDLDAVRRELAALVAQFPPDAGGRRVRLTLDRDGRLELTHVPCDFLPQPGVVPLPVDPAFCPTVVFAREQTDPADPLLQHKTTLRHRYDEARRRALAAGFHDVVFCNRRGEVTESAIANIVVRDRAGLRTPPLSCGLLPGVCRRHLLETLAGHLVETPMVPAELAAAEAVYLVNSVRGVVQVQVAEQKSS